MSIPELPVSTAAVRVFFGKKLSRLSREDFFSELGTTFMPGTPYMLVPLGLAAYLAAVFDPPGDAPELPDEAALIVYASKEDYDTARNESLQGRIYLHSHSGVFDMVESKAQWPGPPAEGALSADGQRLAWYLFDGDVDWQRGVSRVLLLKASAASPDFPRKVHAAMLQWALALKDQGIHQSIGIGTPAFAVVWLHGPNPITVDISALSKMLPDTELVRDLVTEPVPMRTMVERVKIDKPAAFTFHFLRDLRFFL